MSLGNPTLGDLTNYEKTAVQSIIMAVDSELEDASNSLSEAFCTLDNNDSARVWASELSSLSCLLDLVQAQIAHALAVLNFAADRLTLDDEDDTP